MTPEKQSTHAGPKSSAQPGSPSPSARKAWKPKTTVDVILDQIRKQEDKVAGIKESLAIEEKGLTKLLQVKKMLES